MKKKIGLALLGAFALAAVLAIPMTSATPNADKVEVCHERNEKVIEIDPVAVQAHLDHGDCTADFANCPCFPPE